MKLPFSKTKKRGGAKAVNYSFVSSSRPHVDRLPTAEEVRRNLEALEQETSQAFDRIEFMDTKRAEIALTFVKWYLRYVLFVLVAVPLYNGFVIESKDSIDIYKLLGQIGTLLGTPLGFVVGYYFKDDKEK